MEVLLNKGINPSNALALNYVAKHDNIYVIDNHLAAFWCWHKLNLNTSYHLIHIDRHYDLALFYKEFESVLRNTDWVNIHPKDITDIRGTINGDSHQLLQWDNYINMFYELHPNFFNQATFVTQKNGTLNYKGEIQEKDIFEMVGNCYDKKFPVILNIDLDFFFTNIGDSIIQAFTDEYINHVADWVEEESQNVHQIIFCLSPECCISWEQSKRVANIFLSRFGQII